MGSNPTGVVKTKTTKKYVRDKTKKNMRGKKLCETRQKKYARKKKIMRDKTKKNMRGKKYARGAAAALRTKARKKKIF